MYICIYIHIYAHSRLDCGLDDPDQNDKTVSRAQPVSHSISTWGYIPGGVAAGVWG
jgi:hypothetical protein